MQLLNFDESGGGDEEDEQDDGVVAEGEEANESSELLAKDKIAVEEPLPRVDKATAAAIKKTT